MRANTGHSATRSTTSSYHVIWHHKYRTNTARKDRGACARPDSAICQSREVVIVRDRCRRIISTGCCLSAATAPRTGAVHQKDGRPRKLQEEFPSCESGTGGSTYGPEDILRECGAVDEQTVKQYIENQKVGRRRPRVQDHGTHRALSRL